jgi:predicted Zn-dependent protease
MPGFFARMGHANRVYASKLPEFLMTHPVTNSRIADSQGRADAYPYRQRADDLRYHLTRAALRVLQAGDPREAVRTFEGTLRDGRFRNEDAEHYGLALALARAKRYAEAGKQLDQLMATHPNQTEFLVSKARIEGEQKHYQPAIAMLRQALERAPGDFAMILTLSELMIEAEQAEAAYQLLRTEIDRGNHSARLYKVIADAAGQSGRIPLAHGYMAEYYYENGTLEPAILQLEIALRDRTLDDFDAARLQSRLRDFREEKEASEKDHRTAKRGE